MDLFKLMKNMDGIKTMFAEQQKTQANASYKGESGAGWVTIVMDGAGNAKKLVLADEAINEGKEVLSELIVAAINDCNNKMNESRQASMGQLSDLLGGSLPAGFPGFGGAPTPPNTPPKVDSDASDSES